MSIQTEEILSIEGRIKQLIVDALMLPIEAESIRADASIFSAGEKDGKVGLGLDSLAALEIIAAISMEWENPFDDVEPEDMHSVSSLAQYVGRKLAQTGG